MPCQDQLAETLKVAAERSTIRAWWQEHATIRAQTLSKEAASGLRSEICRGARGCAIGGTPGRPPARSIGRIIILKQTPIPYASSRGTTIYGSLSRRDSLARLPPKRKTDLRCKWLTGRCPRRQRLAQKGLCEALRIVIAARSSICRYRHLRGYMGACQATRVR